MKNADDPEKIIPERPKAEFMEDEAPSELQNIVAADSDTEAPEVIHGVVFAKTDFKGLLETDYVQFRFEDLEDPEHKFDIQIGEKSDQQEFPWQVKDVESSYFFLELPVGRYDITSVTIPVGTSTATELMNVTIEVLPNTVTYVGTLKMVGTKEKIKLGGVPVIKPGFEYTVDVIDERDEGAEAFKRNYPNFPLGVSIHLMEVNEQPVDEDEPATED